MKNHALPLLLLLAVLLSACNGITPTGNPIQPTEISGTDPQSLDPLAPGDPVEALLAQMTLAEKIGQMTQVEQYSLKAGDSDKYFIGSVISGGGSVPTTADTHDWAETIVPPAAPQTRLGIPVLGLCMAPPSSRSRSAWALATIPNSCGRSGKPPPKRCVPSASPGISRRS